MPRKGERDWEKEAHWRRVFDDFEQSGVSAPEYCRKNDLKYHTFSDWKRVIAKRDLEAEAARAQYARRKAERARNRSQRTKQKERGAVDSSSQPGCKSAVAFAPVHILDSRPEPALHSARGASTALEIILRNGIAIRVTADCPLDFVSSIIPFLENA